MNFQSLYIVLARGGERYRETSVHRRFIFKFTRFFSVCLSTLTRWETLLCAKVESLTRCVTSLNLWGV